MQSSDFSSIATVIFTDRYSATGSINRSVKEQPLSFISIQMKRMSNGIRTCYNKHELGIAFRYVNILYFTILSGIFFLIAVK